MRLTLPLVVVAAAGLASSQRSPADVTQALGAPFGLGAADLQRIAEGQESVRLLPSVARDGMSAVGGIWIDVPAEAYLRWADSDGDVEGGSNVQVLRRLSVPPLAADFQALDLSEADLWDLSRCRLRACDQHLDVDTIARAAALDWRRLSAAEPAARALVTSLMLRIAAGYLEHGNDALPYYLDTPTPTATRADTIDLLDEEARAGNIPRELLDYLRYFPQHRPSAASSHLYWSTNTFGLKPTTRLNHTVILRGGGPRLAGVVATKLLYASHYFHGALDLRYVLVDPADPGRFLLVTVTRTRSDGLTGLTGKLLGSTIRRRSISALRAYLRFTRESVERRYRSTGERASPPRRP